MSVATLGFVVDSSQAVTATKALNNMTAAAKPAAQAAADLSKASTAGAPALKAHAAAINDNAKAHAGLSTQAMAAQHSIRSMVEMMAMGMPPTQVFASQMNHLSYAATGPGGLSGAFKEAGAALAGLITPMTLAVGGFVAFAAGAALIIKNAVDSSKALDDLAHSINTTLPLLHGLQQVAGGEGISTTDFSAGIKSFGDQVYLAKQNMGDLAGLMRANGMSAKDLQGYLQNVATLVSRTKDDQRAQNLLVAAGLPANEQWVRYMRDLAKGIDTATAGAAQFNDAAEQNMIAKAREFDKAWDSAVTKLVNSFKSAAISIADALTNISIPGWMTKLLTVGASIGGGLAGMALGPLGMVAGAVLPRVIGGAATQPSNFSDRFGAAANNPASGNAALQAGLDKLAGAAAGPQPKTQAELLNENRIAQQRISILGDLATSDDLVRQKELELGATYLQTGVGAGKYKDAILNLVRAQADMSRVQQQAQIGVFNLDAANKAAAETLQSWIDKKLLDPTNANQMAAAQTALAKTTQQLGDAAKVAATPFEGLQRMINEGNNLKTAFDQTTVTSLNGVENALVDITTGTVSAADGFKNLSSAVIRAIEDMIIKITIITPLATALKAALGGLNLGGGLSGIFGGASGGAASSTGAAGVGGLGGLYHSGGIVGSEPTSMRSISASHFANAPRFHTGLMPDEFPAILQKGEGVFTRGQMAAMGGGGSGNVNVTVVNQSSQPVTATQGKDSNGDPMIFLRDAVRGVMADDVSKNGPISQAISAKQTGFNGR